MAPNAFRRGPAGAPPGFTVRPCGPLVNGQDRPAEGTGGGAAAGPRGAPLVVVRLLDDDGVLDNRLQGEDAPLHERLLVAGVLVLRRVLGADHLLGVVYALGDLRPSAVDQLIQLFL